MTKLTKEDFYWVWKDSDREEILNQYYYDYITLGEAFDTIDAAIKFVKTEYNTYPSAEEWRNALLNILDKEQENDKTTRPNKDV